MNTTYTRHLHSILRNLVAHIAIGYTLVFVGLQCIFFLAPEHNIVRLINTLGLWLYMPLPLLLVLTLVARWRAALVLLIPLLWFGLDYGSFFLPHSVEQGSHALRVMTWNVLYTNTEIDAVAATIQAEQPDIVALQELSLPMSAGLSRILKQEYPYQLLQPEPGTRGMGILSRYPVEHVQPATDPFGYCRCQHVIFTIGDQHVEMVNTHPSVPRMNRTKIGRYWLPIGLDTSDHQHTIDLALERVHMRHNPLLLLGDFNMTDRQSGYRTIRSQLQDAYRDTGWGFGLTYPNTKLVANVPFPPIIRIDYLFYSPELAALAAHTGSQPSSDHRYLVVQIAMPN